jgi:hypothetical protein
MKINISFLFQSFILYVLIFSQPSAAQNEHMKFFADNVNEGKVYALLSTSSEAENTFKSKKAFYIKIVPPVFKTVIDTLVLQPALNADLDTANYFVETEVIQISDAAAEWKTAKISGHCFGDKTLPLISLSLQRKSPDYQIVNRRFYPFKDILDISEAEHVIPAQIVLIEKKVLVQKARLETYTFEEKPVVNSGEKLLEMPAGEFLYWKEIQCKQGDFLDPKINEIQLSLKNKGYKVELTNVLDKQTLRAVYEYQADNNMDTEGLTDATVKMLGVERERLIIIE